MERRKFKTKAEARQAVWDALVEARVARFPFPTHGRIPNFEGAREAAQHLLAHPLFHKVHCVKVNPDSPQKPVREALLRRGVMVLVPTPRLKGGFRTFDSAKKIAGRPPGKSLKQPSKGRAVRGLDPSW